MVDYSFYTGFYYGDIVKDSTQFTKLSRKALNELDRMTFNRVSNIEKSNRVDKDILIEKIKMTICELVDIYASVKDLNGIKSKSVGDVSLTYEADSVEVVRSKVYEVISRNLSPTGLMYRGLR